MENDDSHFVGYVMFFMVLSLEYHSNRCEVAFISTGIRQSVRNEILDLFNFNALINELIKCDNDKSNVCN